MAGRRIWAGLQLLDRQMLCRGKRMAGCVDDIELTPSEDDASQWYATAIVSGPGALMYRLNRRRAGRWLQRAYGRVDGRGEDAVLIPFGRVIDIGSHVEIDVEHGELAAAASERWVRDHLISHIPGSGHAPQ